MCFLRSSFEKLLWRQTMQSIGRRFKWTPFMWSISKLFRKNDRGHRSQNNVRCFFRWWLWKDSRDDDFDPHLSQIYKPLGSKTLTESNVWMFFRILPTTEIKRQNSHLLLSSFPWDCWCHLFQWSLKYAPMNSFWQTSHVFFAPSWIRRCLSRRFLDLKTDPQLHSWRNPS